MFSDCSEITVPVVFSANEDFILPVASFCSFTLLSCRFVSASRDRVLKYPVMAEYMALEMLRISLCSSSISIKFVRVRVSSRFMMSWSKSLSIFFISVDTSDLACATSVFRLLVCSVSAVSSCSSFSFRVSQGRVALRLICPSEERVMPPSFPASPYDVKTSLACFSLRIVMLRACDTISEISFATFSCPSIPGSTAI